MTNAMCGRDAAFMISEKRLLEIYGQYKKELYIYIARMVNSPETAEDILHDSFESLIRYSGKYPLEDVNLRSFLYKTAHNLTINHIKKEKRITRLPVEDVVELKSPDNVTADVELAELNGKIHELIDSLDPVSRSIFIMRKEMNFDMMHIAENLDISERTVRRKLNGLLDYIAVELKKAGLICCCAALLVVF